MKTKASDPIAPWFNALESLGEFIGMRFGRIAPGTNDPEWIFIRHADHDGIGAFEEIFLKRGATFGGLPQARHPATPSLSSLVPLLKMHLQPRHPLKWKHLGPSMRLNGNPQPPPAFAWHAFDESETTQMRGACSSTGVTVNSFLLKNLTKAIKPSLEDPIPMVPWMIPVNLRGRVTIDRETANHTSYVSVDVKLSDSVRHIHENIYAAIERHEHCANWFAYELGRLTTHGMRRFLIARELGTSHWNLGAFSNLGVWDPEKKISQTECLGTWFVCPPVLRFQQIGAGCVTFQGKLSLTIQAHPELTIDPRVCNEWMSAWVMEIRSDLAGAATNASVLLKKETGLKI